RSSTYQHRSSLFGHFYYFIHYCIKFLTGSFKYLILSICSYAVSVCWYYYHIQFIDFPKLAGFCFCSTCHTSKLVVHTEVVLQSNSSIGLCSLFYFYIFFCFQRLVQPVRITTPLHHTASLLIYYLNFIFNNNVINIFLKQSILF